VAAARPDAHLYWPMIGKYVGHEAMIEYIRIGDWTLNQGWFQPLSFNGSSIAVSVGPEHFWLNATVQFAFFGNLSDREWQPVVNGLSYKDKCDTRYDGHFYNLAPDPLQGGRMPFGERMSTTGVSYHGPYWVCNTIMNSCTGAYAQFASVTECLMYFSELPIVDPKCAVTGQYGMGASQRCKLIHLFMIETSPEVHCAHVGSRYELDSNGARKCYPEQCVQSPVETTSLASTSTLTTTPTASAITSTASNLTETSSPESWTERCLGLLWPLYLHDYSDCLSKGAACLEVMRRAVANDCGCHPLLQPFVASFDQQDLENIGVIDGITCPEVSSISDRGCVGKTDAEILGQRLALFLNETRAFITIGEDIDETLVAAARPDAHLYWPMIGKYVGHEAMIEYIRIGDWTLNQGWFQPLSFNGSSIAVSVGPEHFWLNATVQFAFFGNLSDREWQPVVNGLSYKDKCDTRYDGHFYNLAPDPLQGGRMPFGERMSTTGVSYHGPYWVCNTIMNSCTGAYAQFASVTECLMYFSELPIVDPKCAVTGQYGMGASQRCKLIHLFMIETSPEVHCAHVGSRYELDSNGARKCYPEQCVQWPVETTIQSLPTTTLAPTSSTALTTSSTSNRQCSSWCSSVQDWRKCEWQNCNGCTECAEFVVKPQCRFWCYLYPSGQQQRTCTWSKCGSCPFCTLAISSTTTKSIGFTTTTATPTPTTSIFLSTTIPGTQGSTVTTTTSTLSTTTATPILPSTSLSSTQSSTVTTITDVHYTTAPTLSTSILLSTTRTSTQSSTVTTIVTTSTSTARGKCDLYCEHLTWSPCFWSNCKGCTRCATPTTTTTQDRRRRRRRKNAPSPTNKCESWCHSSDWSLGDYKCGWSSCSGCTPCIGPQETTTTTTTATSIEYPCWSVCSMFTVTVSKCQFSMCSGCTACIQTTTVLEGILLP